MQRIVAGGPAWGAAVTFAVIVVHPLVGAPLALWPSVQTWWAARAAADRGQHAALRTLPETADLIALGVSAGASIRAAIGNTIRWMDDPFREVFAEALRRADAGETFAAALHSAADGLDSAARPLIGLVAAAEVDGAAVLAGLVRVSDEGRRRRRSRAAIRARRLPVTMLLPLVLCVLPAFGLLAVAPMVLTALGDLDLGL